MARKTLGISWLNGQFHAAALAGGTVTASWSSPEPVTEDADFAVALKEAIRHTRFAGTQAMIIIDHRSLLFHVQDTPPAEGKVVDQILERLVGRSQFFEEKAAWSRLGLPEAKGRHRYLLSLLPDSLIQRLIAACSNERLDLVGVFPIAAILGDQLRLLAAQEGETIILAADLGDALHLLLGRGDGQVLFSRTVALSGEQPAERAAQEINRTLHYAQQQFGATVNKLFVFGQKAFTKLKDFPVRSGLSIAQSPVKEDSLYFCRHVFLLSPKLRLNFIPPAALKKKSIRQLAAAALVLLVFAALSTTVVTEFKVRARERSLLNQSQQDIAETEIRNQSTALQSEANRWRAFLNAVGSTNDPPVPELFTRILPALVPDSARFSRVDIQRAANGWQVHLEGFVADSPGDFTDVIAGIESRLSAAPFNVRIQDGTRRQMTHGGSTSQPGAAKRAGARDNERPFFIEGTIE